MGETMKKIFALDGKDIPHPEDLAMLQALYSRSPASVLEHWEKVKEVGSGKFCEVYYVGYGHASIGDCGTTTLFIEGVSMLAAKALQDSPLYNGQEASTRYLDMSSQPVINPADSDDAKAIQDRWMAFYTKAMDIQISYLKTVFKQGEEGDAKYQKAIKAKAFDILRSFLPAGCATMVSWHTTLRHALDHVFALRTHPTAEVRHIAEDLLKVLQETYPHSFHHEYSEAAARYGAVLQDVKLYNPDNCPKNVLCFPRMVGGDAWWNDVEFKERPRGTRLPHYLDDLGQITYKFQLDFGSFRDLQRHRNGVCRMPLLSTKWGFNEWYLENLAPELLDEAVALIENQTQAINALGIPDSEKQYYVAMGFNVPCKVTRGLPGTIYLIEVRTSKMVHPTMRKVAQDMATHLKSLYPELVMYPDMSESAWDVRRGGQDIVEKK